METIGWKPASQKETSPLDCQSNQFTASQKLLLLFPNAKKWKPEYGNHEMVTNITRLRSEMFCYASHLRTRRTDDLHQK